MTNDIDRRNVLKSLAIPVTGLAAGCEYPRHRKLGLSRIEVNDVAGEGYTFSARPIKSATGGSEEWQTFHDVKILGYSLDRELIGEHRMGIMAKNGSNVYDRVTIRCSKFPIAVTFLAAESPCDGPTQLAIVDYRGIFDGDEHWSSGRDRECNQGLPPPPPEDGWPEPPT